MPPRNTAPDPAPAPPPVSAEEQQVPLATEESTAGSGGGRLATAWPTGKFIVGDIVVTSDGTDLSAEDADKVWKAAEAAGVKLVEMKEGEGK